MKYIIVNDCGLDQAIIFSECLTHAKVAEGFEGQVVGAGFCNVGGIQSPDVQVWGKSQLGIEHKASDIETIEQTIAFRT